MSQRQQAARTLESKTFTWLQSFSRLHTNKLTSLLAFVALKYLRQICGPSLCAYSGRGADMRLRSNASAPAAGYATSDTMDGAFQPPIRHHVGADAEAR